ncbi:hypothetical protein FQR65_LT20852 [Abscondita terminalis]|nr:hypothetical protein FQR65_LT20852 [Abscondita terminalis]
MGRGMDGLCYSEKTRGESLAILSPPDHHAQCYNGSPGRQSAISPRLLALLIPEPETELDEARFLHHHVGAVFQLTGRQWPCSSRPDLLLKPGAPEWQRAALVPMFALFYVVLRRSWAAFADAYPKGQRASGLGLAAYSPAKYGILNRTAAAEPHGQGHGCASRALTIASIILACCWAAPTGGACGIGPAAGLTLPLGGPP